MFVKIVTFIPLLFLAFLAPFPVAFLFAENEEKRSPLTLQKIAVIAREKYELISAQKAKVDEAKFSGTQSTAWQNPYLYTELGHLSESSAGGGRTQEFRLSQPFYFPGKRGKLIKVFEKEKEIQQLTLEELQQNTSLEAVYYVYAYKVAKKKVEHINSRINRFSLIKTFMRSQSFASPQKIIERNIVTNQLITIHKSLNSAVSEKNNIWHKLNLYLNENSEVEIDAPWISVLGNVDEEHFVKTIQEGNYNILKKKMLVDKITADLRYQKSVALPDIHASVYYRREESGPNKFYGAGVTLPLPVLNQNRSGIKAAEKRLQAANSEKKFLEREILQSANAVYAEYNQKRKLLDELKEERLPELERQMKFADRELKLGRIDILSYLGLEMQTHATLHAYYDTQLELIGVILRMIHLQGNKLKFDGDIYVYQNH